eukprot:4365169-Amphidinium_carterae.1
MASSAWCSKHTRPESNTCCSLRQSMLASHREKHKVCVSGQEQGLLTWILQTALKVEELEAMLVAVATCRG